MFGCWHGAQANCENEGLEKPWYAGADVDALCGQGGETLPVDRQVERFVGHVGDNTNAPAERESRAWALVLAARRLASRPGPGFQRIASPSCPRTALLEGFRRGGHHAS